MAGKVLGTVRLSNSISCGPGERIVIYARKQHEKREFDRVKVSGLLDAWGIRHRRTATRSPIVQLPHRALVQGTRGTWRVSWCCDAHEAWHEGEDCGFIR